MEMITGEFQRHFGRYQDQALSQPVTITRNGRAVVMISAGEYRRCTRGSRVVLRADEFSDADLVAIAEARAPEASKAFDDECNQT
jgi:hypothetical protein